MVRESVSNGLDSIREKKTAINILKGLSKVEDHYVEKEGDIYKHSRFNKDYYDLKWLNPLDEVKLTYIINQDSLGRDLFRIEDTGVGLGGERLEGYFNLGYSSKRLNTGELGGFGIGAKSPLATGAASYRLISRYNGKEFKFDIFSHKVDCVYTKWGEDGKVNDYVEFANNGFKAYYVETTEKNSVAIEVEVKKHNKQLIIDAVKSQLMYFKDNINFEIHGEWNNPSNKMNVDFKSNIRYENDDIIISDNRHYARPHFVMKNVSYGLIDFRELELDQRHGNIGIKVSMEEVDVSPSRESVIYSQKTRDAVTAKYNRIADTVTELLSKSIVTDDYLEWIANCSNILYSNKVSTDNGILNELANLIDKFQLKLSYSKDKSIFYDSSLEKLLGKYLTVESVGTKYDYRKGQTSVKRDKVDLSSALTADIYLQFRSPSSKTTSYLATHLHQNGFVVIKPNFPISQLDDLADEYVHGKLTDKEFIDEGLKAIDKRNEDEPDFLKGTDVKKHFKKTAYNLQLIIASKRQKNYDEVVVPETFNEVVTKDGDAIVVTADPEVAKQLYKETLKKRKAEGKFIVHTLRVDGGRNGKLPFEKKEVDTKDLTKGTVIYGFAADEALLRKVSSIIYSCQPYINENLAYNDRYKVIKIANSNEKYVSDKMHVNDFLIQYKDKTLTTDPLIQRMFISKFIVENLKLSNFYKNFKTFDRTLAEDFESLTKMIKNYDKMEQSEAGKVLSKAMELQVYMLDNPRLDGEAIDMKSVELLGADITDTIEEVDILPVHIYEKVQKLNDFSRVYGSIFNEISVLCQGYGRITAELESDIKLIIAAKRDQLEFDYPNLNY